MKRSGFTLKKMKCDSKSLTAIYKAEENSDVITRERRQKPHSDMFSAMNKLIPLITEVFNMNDQSSENISVRGITLSTKKNIDKVIITCMFKTDDGLKCVMNTPNIVVDGTHYENQGNLEDIINEIINETFEYLFNSKQSQQELEFEEPEEEEEEVEEEEQSN
jgi:hypothetical protein